ncbi:MAG TPA: hypothetical protein VMA37_06585 [Acetobacteraceae bacterium]|nr:hypothetical protein [Acetobacteraceae bacterium]
MTDNVILAAAVEVGNALEVALATYASLMRDCECHLPLSPAKRAKAKAGVDTTLAKLKELATTLKAETTGLEFELDEYQVAFLQFMPTEGAA